MFDRAQPRGLGRAVTGGVPRAPIAAHLSPSPAFLPVDAALVRIPANHRTTRPRGENRARAGPESLPAARHDSGGGPLAPRPMRILIVGSSGYLGWPTAGETIVAGLEDCNALRHQIRLARAARLAASSPCARSTSSFVPHSGTSSTPELVRGRPPRGRRGERREHRVALAAGDVVVVEARRSARRRRRSASQAPSTSRSHGSATTPRHARSQQVGRRPRLRHHHRARCDEERVAAARAGPCRGRARARSTAGGSKPSSHGTLHEPEVDGPGGLVHRPVDRSARPRPRRTARSAPCPGSRRAARCRAPTGASGPGRRARGRPASPRR